MRPSALWPPLVMSFPPAALRSLSAFLVDGLVTLPARGDPGGKAEVEVTFNLGGDPASEGSEKLPEVR